MNYSDFLKDLLLLLQLLYPGLLVVLLLPLLPISLVWLMTFKPWRRPSQETQTLPKNWLS